MSPICTFSHQNAEAQHVMFYYRLYKTRIGGRSYSSTQTVHWIFTQTKLSSIYRHTIVTYWALKKRQALLKI